MENNSFTEEELLILSNYVYYDSAVKYKTIDEMLKDYNSDTIRGQGGMQNEDAVKLFDIIKNKAKESDFGQIRVERTRDEGGIRGVCFTKEDGSAAVVFRGTGGSYEAWEDNVIANYKSDTRMQKIAADFVKYDCGEYENLIIAGHSKGGNLAQYSTVMCYDRVDKCVSFDGQGMSNEFLEMYGEEVSNAKGKIYSICADNDYVNVLLTSIAGTTLYIKNKYSGPVGAHSGFSLLDSATFDENGNVVRDSCVNRNALVSALAGIIASISLNMEKMKDDGEKIITDLIAALVAGSPLCADRDTNAIDEEYNTRIKAASLYKYVKESIFPWTKDSEEVKITYNYSYFDYDVVNMASDCIRKVISDSERINEAIIKIDSSLSRQIIAYIPLGARLSLVTEKITDTINDIGEIKYTLDDIVSYYIKSSNDAINIIENIQTS